MKALTASKTILLALVFVGLAVAVILFDALVHQLRFVIELFSLMTAIFVASAGKNGWDNWSATKYQQTTVQSERGQW